MNGFKLRKGARARGPAVKGNNGGGAFNLARTECTHCQRNVRSTDVVYLVRQVSTGKYFFGNRRAREWMSSPDNGGVWPFCPRCVESCAEAG